MLQRIGSWVREGGKGYNRELMYEDSGLEQGDNDIATEEEGDWIFLTIMLIQWLIQQATIVCQSSCASDEHHEVQDTRMLTV